MLYSQQCRTIFAAFPLEILSLDVLTARWKCLGKWSFNFFFARHANKVKEEQSWFLLLIA